MNWYELADALSLLKRLALEGLIDYEEATKTVEKLCKKHIGEVV